MNGLLEQAHARLNSAAHHARVSSAYVQRVKHPRQTIKNMLPIDLDDGSHGLFPAWFCRHDEERGPLTGRLILDPSSVMETVEARALLITLKGALLDLPICGAAGAVRVDPALLPTEELLRLERIFAEELGPLTNHGDESVVALGGVVVLEALKPDLRLAPGARVSIRGFGRVGQHVARLLDEAGYAIVAVGDSLESVQSQSGLPVAKLIAAKEAGVLGAVSAGRGVARAHADAALGADCDLLICAGAPGTVNRNNARIIRAGTVLELADGAVACNADEILEDRGVEVIPDILATAFEPARMHLRQSLADGAGNCTPEAVEKWLTERTEIAARSVRAIASEHAITMRTAANALALDRLGPAII